jgi:hypothetical protein
LARALGAVSVRLGPAEAAPVAATLADALGRETDQFARSRLAEALGAVSVRLGPAEAARVCGGAIKTLLRRRLADTGTRDARGSIDRSISLLNPFTQPEVSNLLAAELCSLSIAEAGYLRATGIGRFSVDLPAALLPDKSLWRQALTQSVLSATVPDTSGPAGVLAAVTCWKVQLPRCQLSTQQLVDLLKMPTCYGVVRRAVLDQLGYLSGRSFVNHWAFVRFALETKLDVDLTSPPRRPAPRESLRRMLEALDGQLRTMTLR